MKKRLSQILAVLLSLLLAACGNHQSNTTMEETTMSANENITYLSPANEDLNRGALPAEVNNDTYAGFTSSDGWKKDMEVSGPMTKYVGTMKITNKAVAEKEQLCRYRPDLQVDGNVRISVHLNPWRADQNPMVQYEVHHNEQVDVFQLDLTGLTESGWYCLGSFDFTGPEKTNYLTVVPVPTDVPTAITRASAVCFEVLNNAASADVWQVLYLAPNPDTEANQLAELNALTDIPENNPNKYDLEYLYNEGIITTVSEGVFAPDEAMRKIDLMDWLENLLGQKTLVPIGTGYLTGEDFARILWEIIPTLN
jgi:hypothetical protein